MEIAYGIRQFVPNAGLYYSAEPGETITSEDKVTIMPFFDSSDEHILGGTFNFRGFRFMLYLGEDGFTDKLTFFHKDSNTSSQFSRPLRHLAALHVSIGPSRKYWSHVINFKWR